MEFLRTIMLARESEIVGEIELNCSVVNNVATISYIDSFAGKGKKDGPSFFYALAEIRDEYIKRELVLLCNGAKKTVFPGGLISDSSFGELAYEIMSVSDEQKVVNIFDCIDISQFNAVSSFDEQKITRRNIIRYKQNIRNER